MIWSLKTQLFTQNVHTVHSASEAHRGNKVRSGADDVPALTLVCAFVWKYGMFTSTKPLILLCNVAICVSLTGLVDLDLNTEPSRFLCFNVFVAKVSKWECSIKESSKKFSVDQAFTKGSKDSI